MRDRVAFLIFASLTFVTALPAATFSNSILAVSTSGVDCGTYLCQVSSVMSNAGLTSASLLYSGGTIGAASYTAELIPEWNTSTLFTTPITSLPGNPPFSYIVGIALAAGYARYLAVSSDDAQYQSDLSQAMQSLVHSSNAVSLDAQAMSLYQQLVGSESSMQNIFPYGILVPYDPVTRTEVWNAEPIFQVETNSNGTALFPFATSQPGTGPASSLAPEPASFTLCGGILALLLTRRRQSAGKPSFRKI